MSIDPQTSLASLVLEEPGRADLFERLGLDYCCRGERSLADAAAQHDLDLDTVVRVLEAHAITHAAAEHDYDWRRASTADLCDHIVEAHHERMRRELPQLLQTLETVVRVHGGADPRLHDLARVVDRLATDLLPHLDREEQRLFPACRALEAGEAPAERQGLLDELEHDHADVGETLAVLRDLAGGYRTETARCGTHRALLRGLHALERDLHQHVHEENNVLFPRIRSLLTAREERA